METSTKARIGFFAIFVVAALILLYTLGCVSTSNPYARHKPAAPIVSGPPHGIIHIETKSGIVTIWSEEPTAHVVIVGRDYEEQ